VWQEFGNQAAFALGAGLALTASIMLLFVRNQRPGLSGQGNN